MYLYRTDFLHYLPSPKEGKNMFGKFISAILCLVGFIAILGIAYLFGLTPSSPDYQMVQKNAPELLLSALIASAMIVGGFWGMQYKHHC